MLTRHDKELEQIKRMNIRKEEELLKRQAIEKRALPKRIRNEMKAREMMYRESVRISMASTHTDPEDEREKLKKVGTENLQTGWDLLGQVEILHFSTFCVSPFGTKFNGPSNKELNRS